MWDRHEGGGESDHAVSGRRGVDDERLEGLKGYVTNIPVELMPAAEVIASYHSLWQVEASFRMSKTDLRARPMFHHTRDAIEAHLTIVFTALALAREVQARTGLSIRNVIRQLRLRLPPNRGGLLYAASGSRTRVVS